MARIRAAVPIGERRMGARAPHAAATAAAAGSEAGGAEAAPAALLSPRPKTQPEPMGTADALGCGVFERVAREFRPYHSNSVNAALHLVTTPLALAGAAAAAGVGVACLMGSPGDGSVAAVAAAGVCAAYAASLLPYLSLLLWGASTVVCAATGGLAVLFVRECGLYGALAAFAAGYVLQDLAHFATGERTYQSAYQGRTGWLVTLAAHTFFLVPLVLDALCHTEDSILAWPVPHDHVMYARLDGAEEVAHRATLREWVIEQKPSAKHTTHWWYERLPEAAKASFHALAMSGSMLGMFRARFPGNAYTVEPVFGMNEIYVASDQNLGQTSDNVFYMLHTDGPWGVFPMCGLYRCILAISPNEQVATRFPFSSKEFVLTDGDVAAFDFNREIHDIKNVPGRCNEGQRITLNVHYVVYPTVLRPYGKLLKALTTTYNTLARLTFLNTIQPRGLWRLAAWLVLKITSVRFRTEMHAGWTNVSYVAACALAAHWLGDYRLLVAMTSFVHYFMYIGTYHAALLGLRVSFGHFKRDVVFYKAVAYAHICNILVRKLDVARAHASLPVAAAMVCIGYGLAAAASVALGLDQTYFGAELGECKPRFVTAFPYGRFGVPHPMILGAITGLVGLQLTGAFVGVPWLIPTHIGLYLLHMLQEQACDMYSADAAIKAFGHARRHSAGYLPAVARAHDEGITA